jgi:hypothetical protein|tara:strand:+ start:28 stop:162 length:135 start_codon:yes stop_codon:yes gene_type:complete
MEKKKNRQYRSRQGRSDDQYATSIAIFAAAVVGLALLLIVAIIL